MLAQAGDQESFHFQLHALHFRRPALDERIVNLKGKRDGMNDFLVGHICQIGFALGYQPFDVMVGDFAIGFGSSYHGLGSIRAEADAADGNDGVSDRQAGNFFQRFYGCGNCFGSVVKIDDVALSDPFGLFWAAASMCKESSFFRSTTIALIEELPISRPVIILRAI